MSTGMTHKRTVSEEGIQYYFTYIKFKNKRVKSKYMYIVCYCLVTKLRLTLVTPWTVTCQAPLSLGFSRQEYWGGLPVPSPGDLPNPGIKPRSPALQADSLPTELLAIVNSMADSHLFSGRGD